VVSKHKSPPSTETVGDAEVAVADRYRRGVLFMLRRQTGDAALAEDLCQETFRIVIERLRTKGLEQPELLNAFIRSTARNVAIGEYRKHARRKTDADTDAVERAGGPGGDPERIVGRAEHGELVHQVLDELNTDRDREILYRFYIAEEDKDAICADLGLSALHFNRVLFRARQRFKELYLARTGGDSDD
jgi:RNA polymerase sigma-70 factor (ECF subfamily)